MRSALFRSICAFVLGVTLIPADVAHAEPTLAQVQAQVNRLEEEATTAAEGAQRSQGETCSVNTKFGGNSGSSGCARKDS
jgi:hypothetical protein